MGCDVQNKVQVNTAGSCGRLSGQFYVQAQEGHGVDSGAVTLCLLLFLPPAACGLCQTFMSNSTEHRVSYGCHYLHLCQLDGKVDHLCGLVVRVSGYRYRGLGFDSQRYQIF